MKLAKSTNIKEVEMKTYKRSIQMVLFTTVIFMITGVIQLIVNIYYDRVFFILLFLILTSGFLVYIIILTLDLITKDIKMMEVIIIECNTDIIKVLKTDGKKRGIRIIKSESNKYQINQELVLTLTKRTGLIKDITVR